jgi:hypothetical protein
VTSDAVLVGLPLSLAVVLVCTAAASGWLYLSARKVSSGTAASQGRDALIFAAGALLLAAFFLFNADFAVVMG